MDKAKSRALRAGLLLVGVTFIGYHIRQQVGVAPPAQAQQSFPPEGRVMGIDTGGKVPGDPQNAVEDLLLVRKLIGIYKERHGQLPQDMFAIWKDIIEDAPAYGFKDFMEARATLTNPDNRFSDDDGARQLPEGAIPYLVDGKRPDGTAVGTAKAAGTRDIIAYTGLYVHTNTRHFKGERSGSNPVGFYVVLWDDGKIEKVAYDQQLYVPTEKKGQWTFALVGQAGVPSNALTYDQFYQQFGAKRGPRGAEGAKGKSYKEW